MTDAELIDRLVEDINRLCAYTSIFVKVKPLPGRRYEIEVWLSNHRTEDSAIGWTAKEVLLFLKGMFAGMNGYPQYKVVNK